MGRTFGGILSPTLKGKPRRLVIVLSEFPLLSGFKNVAEPKDDYLKITSRVIKKCPEVPECTCQAFIGGALNLLMAWCNRSFTSSTSGVTHTNTFTNLGLSNSCQKVPEMSS